MHEDKNPDSESNVWASYSDLFTNVAIIFLVMFVFALIKSTVSQFKNVQTKMIHEKELKAKLSEKEIKKGQERIAKVEKAIGEMRQYEQVIDQKVLELNNYAKKLQENKLVLKEMIESQEKQDSLMKAAEERLEEKQREANLKEKMISESKERIDALNEELRRLHEESLKREDFVVRKIASQSEVVEKVKSELTQTRSTLTKKESELKEKTSKLTSEIQSLREEAVKLQGEIQLEKTGQKSQMALINELKKQLGSIEDELKENKKTTDKLALEKSALTGHLNEVGHQRDALQRNYAELEKQMAGASEEREDLLKKLQELGSQSAKSQKLADKWKGDFEKQMAEADKLKGQLHESNLRFRQLADTMGKLKDTVKNNVALKLQEQFQKNGLDAKVDLKTGEVILLSGEGFNFEKGSAKLSKEAKIILKKIIPIYSNVLLGDEKVYSQISLINMEGHSSPSFGGKYVPPTEMNADAYSFNMRLSAMRASSVASYLMSKEIGDYPHKDRMKFLLQSVGMAYMKPLPIEKEKYLRGPASTEYGPTGACGPWDCYKSQRVQINFLLKDNMEEIKKIIDANGVIK
jgi:chromosome segregation ATPase